MRDDLPPGYPSGRLVGGYIDLAGVAAPSIKADDRTTAERLADVLSESHREDTSADFRLGLLQGALAVALPELVAATAVVNQTVRIDLKREDLLRCADEVAAAMKNTRGVAGASRKSRPGAKAKTHRPSRQPKRGGQGHA